MPLDLSGQCLIAMPGMSDDRFSRAVILLTSHDDEGAMGIVVNRQVLKPTFGSVLDELDIPYGHATRELHDRVPIYEGGPVEQGRGFVVHSLDYSQSNTRRIGEHYGLTTTLEILKNIAGGGPPGRFLLALGYAGWNSGQLRAGDRRQRLAHLRSDQRRAFRPAGGKPLRRGARHARRGCEPPDGDRRPRLIRQANA